MYDLIGLHRTRLLTFAHSDLVVSSMQTVPHNVSNSTPIAVTAIGCRNAKLQLIKYDPITRHSARRLTAIFSMKKEKYQSLKSSAVWSLEPRKNPLFNKFSMK